MLKHTQRLLLTVLNALLCACTLSFPNDGSAPTKIIGENDLTPVRKDATNIPESLRPLMPAFGVLEIGCTVTHIGQGLVLTAGHCIPQTDVVEDECLAKNFAKMTIRWNYLDGEAAVRESSCLRVLATASGGAADYALLSVDNPPEAAVGVEFNKRSAVGTAITLFGHPRKRPLEWSRYCAVSAPPESVLKALPAKDHKLVFAHQCDTEQGNSGAALIEMNSLKIIGIHHGGIEPWNTAMWVPASTLSKAIRTARDKMNNK